MPFCLNPACPKPENPDSNLDCHGCHNKLIDCSRTYQFDHYQIIKVIGKGGFGRTYLAKDIDLFNKKVVIKKLIAIDNNNPKIAQLFQREAQQLDQLSHPQIPKLYRYFTQNDAYYLVQEYIEGENLLTEFGRLGRFSEAKIKEILETLLPVLKYIQDRDILHRDIKPENIMRRHFDNQLMLIDFGAVRVKTSQDPSILTCIYTPGYAAREQMNARPVKASDIYSLGVTCIRLLTGCLPSGSTDLIYDDSKNKWRWQEYLQERNISIDPRLARILDQMVEDTLENRYPDAKAVMRDLLSVEESRLVQSTIVNQPSQPITSSQPLSRQNFLKWGGSAGLGAIASLVLGKFFNNKTKVPVETGQDSPPTPPTPSNFREFSFKTVTVDSGGETIKTENKSAQYQTLDLGNGVTMDLVYIPSGTFLMGSPDTEADREENEGPQHQVTLPGFWMGKYLVTQAQWSAIMANNPSRFSGDDRPVEQVTWEDAVKFCEQLSQKTGKNLSLPSEAQWEYACRSETTTPFAFGETLTPELANYNTTYTYANAPKGIYREETTAVVKFLPNAFGLSDTHGNVWEWCLDSYHNSYQGAPNDGRAWVDNDNTYRILRGGSWLVNPRFCRSAYRVRFYLDKSDIDIGFRIVLPS